MKFNLEELVQTLIPWAIQGALAVVIFFVGRICARWLANRLALFLGKHGLNALLVKLSRTTAYVALLLLVTLASLEQLGIDTTSALAVFGAASLAVGLAVKDSLSNFASGVLIAFFEPFSIGHYVEAGGTSGTVIEVGMFNTNLLTLDNRRIIVPNSVIYNGIIINYSAEETRRVDLIFGIGYDDNIEQAKSLIAGIIEADTRILKDPTPIISVAELADSSVNLNVWPWVKGDDFWAVRADLLEKVKTSFDANGISIPYPQQDVHMHQTG
jgi:small conductance mechanosensitive channel